MKHYIRKFVNINCQSIPLCC